MDVGLVAGEQMPEIWFLTCDGTSVWMPFQAEDRLFETSIPFPGSAGMLGVYVGKNERKVTPRTGGDVNAICHALLRTRRKILALAGPCFS